MCVCVGGVGGVCMKEASLLELQNAFHTMV